MKKIYNKQPNGYEETIRKGLEAVRALGSQLTRGRGTKEENVERLKQELATAEAIVIGAGAGLSTAAGFTYGGERFQQWFPDFAARYGIRDMYAGGFYPYPSKEIFWAFWARNIYINRYVAPPKPVYEDLFRLVRDKEYFVITTNVDHCFQKAGFDKKRLFYTQGDYGLFQSVEPGHPRTWDNEEWVKEAMAAQGFELGADGKFHWPEQGRVLMQIPKDLIPHCPEDGTAVTLNLRSDDTFVEDAGWHRASAAYADFLHRQEGKHVLYLELGVGNNTPVIVKYPFWQLTKENPKAVYACINYGQAFCPGAIEDRSLCIDGDIGEVIKGV